MKTKQQPKTTNPVPVPEAWQNESIKLPAPPAKPILGKGHQRIPLLGAKCPPRERAARKWFFVRLSTGGVRGRLHAAPVTVGSSRPLFLSVEAYKLWSAHKAFWMQEYQSSVARKEAASRDARRKINKSLGRAASKASITATDLKAKMKRLKALLEDDQGQTLALELIKAAEPWLLEALLAGVALRKSRHHLDLDHGAFFSAATYSSRSVLPFWLTVVRALAAGCCPRGLNTKNLFSLDLSARNAAEMDIITGDILPHLSAVQEMELSVEAFPFSTASLPVMPLMSRLILNNRKWFSSCEIKIQSLDQQRSLKACILTGGVSLQIDGDQEQLFERVRLETSQGGCRINPDGLRCIDLPPETYGCITGINLPAARVLARMCVDHSSNPEPPQWWNGEWVSPEWWDSNGYGVYKSSHGVRRLNLGDLVSIDLEVADVFANSMAPICIPASLLTAEILGRFTTSKSEIHISDFAGNNLPLAQDLRGLAAPKLTIQFTDSLLPDTARALAAFSGTSLTLILSDGNLDAGTAEALSCFSGNLTLELPHYRASGFDQASAEKFIQKKGRFQIKGEFKLDSETLRVLFKRSDFDLGELRLRCFEKRIKGKGVFCKVQIQFNPSTESYELEVTKGAIGESGASKQVRISSWSSRGNFVKKLMDDGYHEISSQPGAAATSC